MFKKYFTKLALFVLALVVVPLQAAQNVEEEDFKNNSQAQPPPNQKSDNALKENDSSVKLALEKEKEKLENLLEIHMHHYGDSHPKTAIIMEDLGIVLVDLGAYSSAKSCLEKVLAIKENAYNSTHLDTASTMENLGNVLLKLGAYKSGQNFLEKALKILEKHCGADHLSIIISLDVIFRKFKS